MALPGLPAAFETPGIGLSIAGRREVDLDIGVRAAESGALSLIGSGPVSQPRLSPRFDARRLIERRGQRRDAVVARRARGVEMRRATPNSWPSPAHGQRGAIGGEREAALVQLLRPDELVERQVRRARRWRGTGCPRAWRSCRASDRAQFALGLPLDGRGIDLQPACLRRGSRPSRSASASARSAQMRPRLRVDDGRGVVSGISKTRLSAKMRRVGVRSIVALVAPRP